MLVRICSSVRSRDAELQTFLSFAEKGPGEIMAVMALTGVEGIGKTRLGLAWLSRLKAHGWDAGVLKTSVRQLDIERARFRRKTAILVDEPSSSVLDLYNLLDAFSAKKQRLRIVVADRLVMPPPVGGQQGGPMPELQLEPLSDDTLIVLAPALSVKALASAEGRPLYALLGESPARITAERAYRRLAEAGKLGGEEAQRLLAMAALAGPTGTRNLPPSRTSISLLRRLFKGAPRDLVTRTLPALRPHALPMPCSYSMCKSARPTHCMILWRRRLRLNAPAVETRLASLWTLSEVTDEQHELRSLIQE